jgi:hypothetical protein
VVLLFCMCTHQPRINVIQRTAFMRLYSVTIVNESLHETNDDNGG